MFDIPNRIRRVVTAGHQPYVSAEENIAELTVRAIILGLVLGALMTAANTYLGLYIATEIVEIQGCHNP